MTQIVNHQNRQINDRKFNIYTSSFGLFNINLITFNDLFFLSKDDLIEMKIPLGPRNRILKFIDEYKKYVSGYNIEELDDFFETHRSLIINKINDFNMTRSKTYPHIKRNKNIKNAEIDSINQYKGSYKDIRKIVK